MKKITPELRERALHLIVAHQANSLSTTEAIEQAANELGVAETTVRRWLTESGSE